MAIPERLIKQACGTTQRIALPESQDPRILQAAIRLEQTGLAEPVLLYASKASTIRHTSIPALANAY